MTEYIKEINARIIRGRVRREREQRGQFLKDIRRINWLIRTGEPVVYRLSAGDMNGEALEKYYRSIGWWRTYFDYDSGELRIRL